MESIQDREVIPIVGEELLWYPETDGEPSGFLYDKLARRFAEDCNLKPSDSERNARLGSLFVLHPLFDGSGSQPYEDCKDLYKEMLPEIPESLRKLARIDPFQVFISTTFDDLLERAINAVRFGGRPKTQVISYRLKKVPEQSTIDAALRSGFPVVFKLFGSIDRPLDGYAVTESDYVEFMHELQSRERRPERLFAELEDKHILLLGNSLPVWLTRFFLRLTRPYPLWSLGRTRQYLADSIFRQDPYLHFFLDRCTRMTEVVPDVTACEFVDHLYARWSEIHPVKDWALRTPDGLPASGEIGEGAIFISYARTTADGRPSPDATIAATLKQDLEELGLDVWLDTKGGVQAGELWEAEIRRNINRCGLFLPLLSATTESRDEGFFRTEWAYAVRRNGTFTGANRPFIVPIAIDRTNTGTFGRVPEEFKATQAAALPEGRTTPEFLERILSLVMAVRRQERRSI